MMTTRGRSHSQGLVRLRPSRARRVAVDIYAEAMTVQPNILATCPAREAVPGLLDRTHRVHGRHYPRGRKDRKEEGDNESTCTS